MTDYQAEKKLVLNLFQDLDKADKDGLKSVFSNYYAEDHVCYAVYPFNEIKGCDELVSTIWEPFCHSFTRLQRRQDVFIAGTNEISGDKWVMSMGHFMGLFDNDWLGIRATRKLAMVRYAEFFCIENGKIVKTGLFFDILGLMNFVGINPLPPSTGQHFVYPGPVHHNGLLFDQQDDKESVKTLEIVNMMIADLNMLNASGEDEYSPDILARTWHDDMGWYGPYGIGASYTIERYQQQHSFPFRQGLKGKTYNGHVCRFAEGEFACFFGWPNLTNTPSGGFLGLPGGGKSADMRVVDVYYREGDKLRENWIFIDFPYWFKQQGLDILERTQGIVNP